MCNVGIIVRQVQRERHHVETLIIGAHSLQGVLSFCKLQQKLFVKQYSDTIDTEKSP